MEPVQRTNTRHSMVSRGGESEGGAEDGLGVITTDGVHGHRVKLDRHDHD